MTAAYVVGTDGAHSAVRRLIGVDFVGEQYATHIMLADVRLARPPGETLFGATTNARASCSSCPSATAGSGPSPGTAAARRCRSPSR